MKFLRDRDNALAASWMINSIGYSIVYPFIPLYLHQGRGLPMSQVGLIFPVMGAACIVMPPLAGALSDRFSRAMMIRIGQGARGTLCLLLTLMVFLQSPFWLFCIILFLNTCSGVLFENGADAYLGAVTTPETRPRAYSKIRIGTNIGWALGPAAGAFLSHWPYEALFLMTGVLCWGAERFSACLLPEPERPPAARVSGTRERNPLWHDHFMLWVFGGAFLLYMLSSQLYSVLSVYSTEVVKLTRFKLGMVYSLNGATIILAQIPVTLLLEKLKLRPIWRLALGTTLYTCGYFFLGFAGGFVDVAAAVIVLTLGETVFQVALYSTTLAAAPANRAGRYLAVQALIRGTAYSLGPYLGSLLYGGLSAHPVTLWSILAAFGALATLVFCAVGRRPKNNKGV